MYTKARLRLTLLYTLLFSFFVILLSLGVYFWFRQSLGEGYITAIKVRHIQQDSEEFDITHTRVATIAGGVALDQLEDILLSFNFGLLLLAPLFSWYLTSRTLKPIEESYEKQRAFVSDASHEMRTPLSIISGELEVALRKKRKSEDYRRVLIVSKEEIEKLKVLVENLLFLARSDQKNVSLNFKQVDITDLVFSVISELDSKASKKKINLKFLPAKESLIVLGNEAMLRTLFLNLIDNAIKYTPQKGKVWIKLDMRKKYVVITIKDSGIGIAQKDKIKIFDRFYRVDTSRANVKGFGLGLSIVKSITQMHNGKISLVSQPGKGSSFSVFLPKAE